MPTTITGPVRLPDGTIPAHGRIIFQRRAAGVASEVTLPGPVEVPLDANGAFTVELQGEATGTRYAVKVEYQNGLTARLIAVDLPDVVVTGTGSGALSDYSTLRLSTRDTYDHHRGDTFSTIITALDGNLRPADISDSTVAAWLEQGDVSIPITATIVDAVVGTVQIGFSAVASATLAIGHCTVVIAFTVGSRVNTLRGKIKII